MTKLFSYLNRLRGAGHSTKAIFIMSIILNVILMPMHYYLNSYHILLIPVVITLALFYMFKWAPWGSEYWNSLGKEGDKEELTKLWKTKGTYGFIAIGAILLDPVTAYIGHKLGQAGEIYFQELAVEMPDSIEKAEKRIGSLLEKMFYITIAMSIFKLALVLYIG